MPKRDFSEIPADPPDPDGSIVTPLPDPNIPKYHQLAEYLDVLGSDMRLQILHCIEREPKSIREIQKYFSEANRNRTYLSYNDRLSGNTYENISKHILKLSEIGLVKYGPEQKNNKEQPVKTYELVPGRLELILRTLLNFPTEKPIDPVHLLQHIHKKLSGPHLFLKGGEMDGLKFPLSLSSTDNIIRLGRVNPGFNIKERDIVVDNRYRVVTRISQPHAEISFIDGNYYIEDRKSRRGTFLNKERLVPFRKTLLHNNDSLELGDTSEGAFFIVYLPEPDEKGTSG